MPLRILRSPDKAVRDIAAPAGMPIECLSIANTRITDLRPLAGLALRAPASSPGNGAIGLAKLRRVKSLARIGAPASGVLPAKGFWQQLDQPGK